MIVAIDGPAGAGKSTVALGLAQALGLTLVDTGAIYRSVAFCAQAAAVATSDEAGLAALLPGLAKDLSFIPQVGRTQIVLRGQDISERIRTPQMSQDASALSAWPKVRAGLLELQRGLGRGAPAPGAVLEGRDIGTVVFPDAEAKFFLTASPLVRAERRHRELLARGLPSSLDQVLRDQEKRDHDDSTRAAAPLKQSPDAVLIDSTDLDLAHVIERMVAVLRDRKLA